MRSMPSKTTLALVCHMILAAVLVLTACTPAAAVAPPQLATAPTAPPPASIWAPAARTKASGCVTQAGLPDPACTPGTADPRVNQGDLATTVCRSGYTATVRPPVGVTEPIKRQQMLAYGLQGQPLSTTELDHLIPLELGGASDVANLWPEPRTGDMATGRNQVPAAIEHVGPGVSRSAIYIGWIRSGSRLPCMGQVLICACCRIFSNDNIARSGPAPGVRRCYSEVTPYVGSTGPKTACADFVQWISA